MAAIGSLGRSIMYPKWNSEEEKYAKKASVEIAAQRRRFLLMS
jgi:hypothetical protein